MTKEKNDTKEQINLEEELTSKIEEYQARRLVG